MPLNLTTIASTTALCWLVAALSAHATPADPFFDKLLMLGTGTQGGAFWPIGESLCAKVNEARSRQQVRCVANLTAGSVYNINAVAFGQLQLGMAQEDLVLDHVQGRRGAGFEQLRQVAVLHNSPISVVVRGDTGVQQLAQIKGLRLNLGNRGSGQFTVSTAIVRAMGWREVDFAAVTYEPTSAFERIFCGGKVDVVVEIVPHPVDVFARLLDCGGRLLDIPDDVARRLVAGNAAFRPMAIAAGSYPQLTRDMQSVGVRNLLISHTRVSTESIRRLTQSLAGQLAALKQDQPLLSTMPELATGDAAGGAQPVPLHDGVLRARQP